MRVLMVSDVFFPRINGVSTSIETFRCALAEQNVSVKLVVPSYGDDSPTPDITRVPASRVLGDPEDRLAHYPKLRKATLLAASDCDVIHIQTPFAAHYAGLHAARILNKPTVTTYHTLFEEYLQHYIPWLPGAMLRGMARRFSRGQCNDVDAVIVPSSAMQTRLTEYGVTRPLHIIPTGLPSSAFTPGDATGFRSRHGIDPNRPVALFVGRVAHEKNIGFLLESMALAIRALPELLLLITGEGPARADLEKQAARLGIQNHVRFLGYLDRKRELPSAYAAANVFVFASRTETQGLVLLEAMAQKCPVVGLSVMGTADILEPRRGCRIAPDTHTGFASTLVALLNSPESRIQLGDEALAYAHEWSDRALAARLADLYRSLLR
ncbi:MAG: glycosyl transferase family 1 [Hydrogenophilales bacterium 28-61-23]|nr:MAG: glycosyl transferase family 1 [Hydrogenophilales bacterium 28-61-23]